MLTFYDWRTKYCGMDQSMMKRVKSLRIATGGSIGSIWNLSSIFGPSRDVVWSVISQATCSEAGRAGLATLG